MLVDDQDRGQVGGCAGQRSGGSLGGPTGLGAGWLLFDRASDPTTIAMRTFSTHPDGFSSGLPAYADWDRAQEPPKMSDAELPAAEEYDIVLQDFRKRFGPPAP